MTQSDLQFTYDVRAAMQAEIEDLVRMRLALQAHFVRANPYLVRLSAQKVTTLTDFYGDLMRDPQARVLVAHEPQGTQRSGMAVGRIVRHEGFEPAVWGHIDDVWVEPAYRHRGICRALIARLLGFFEGAQIEVLVLDYVIGNPEAEGTWKQFGFQPVLTVANAKLHEVRKQLWREPT
jgi:ribosomal protein S18 acetylase RimI-like enzyme